MLFEFVFCHLIVEFSSDESDVKCLSLEDPDGGQVSISGDLTPGSVATYSCDDGRTLFGSSTRDCQSDGTWSDETPKCDYRTYQYY